MIWVWRKALLGLLLTLPTVSAAKAQSIVLWDSGIAAAVRSQVQEPEACGPYDLYRPQCAEHRLRFGDDDDDWRLTTLDHLVLFVHRYKDVNLKSELRPGTQLKFQANMLSLYEQEAKARLELRVRF
jgi:hypothetical protein